MLKTSIEKNLKFHNRHVHLMGKMPSDAAFAMFKRKDLPTTRGSARSLFPCSVAPHVSTSDKQNMSNEDKEWLLKTIAMLKAAVNKLSKTAKCTSWVKLENSKEDNGVEG
jgi:hypothetical protein